MQEAWVWSLHQEDPLEKGMVTLSSILVWRIPWTEEPGRLYSPWGHKESGTTEWLTLTNKTFSYTSYEIISKMAPCVYHKFCLEHIYLKKLILSNYN